MDGLKEQIIMIRNVLIAALAGATLTVAVPALARPGGGAGGSAGANANVGAGANAGASARLNSQGSINASPNGALNSHMNSAVRATTTRPTIATPTTPTTKALNSQGPLNASPNGIAHASPNSVLARGAVTGTALPGLTTGLNVQTSAGVSLGTVSQVVTGADGSIRAVIITSPTGQTTRLAPNTLSISGGVVTTTTGG
jgi:hypothetical protein